MRKRTQLKKAGLKVLKKHYLFFVVVCLMASFIGAEFGDSLSIARFRNEFSSNEQLIIEDFTNDEFDEAKELVQEKQEAILKKAENNKYLGRSRGALSSIINAISTGSIYIRIIQAITSISRSTSLSLVFLIIISLTLSFIIWFLITIIYQVISRRIFLEGRTYSKVSKQRFLYLLHVRLWTKVAITMFLKYLFQFLWSLTIIGGIIKRYSYYLVPYILAENPDINSLDAITLSRQMMNGHKWECFVLELTFIGWELLGMVTLGITKVFFSNPYKVSTMCEYYSDIRSLAIENKIPNYKYLNDQYLFEKASHDKLEKTYADIVELQNKKIDFPKRDKGFRAFLVNMFGITTYSREEEELYEQEELRKNKISYYKDVINGKSYPNRLFSIQEKDKRKIVENINYLRNYSLTSIIMLFFMISFIGWIWEVSLHLITEGTFVNRGTLHGPWLPIYGSGGILILIVLNKFRKQPLTEFITTIALCGVVEYSTSYYLEVMHNGTKWWDYSGYFLNLNGRICAEGLLVFGLGGLVIVYILAPLLDNVIRKIEPQILVPLCIILLCIFFFDQQYSSRHPNEGKGITDYATLSKGLEYRRI